MKTIFKYSINSSGISQTMMPLGAVILAVQMQDDGPKIWALVDTDAPMVTRQLRVYGTGWPIAYDRETYIGTWQEMRGALVWHLFEVM